MANGKIEKNDLIAQEAIDQIENLKKIVTDLVAELSKLTKEQTDLLNANQKVTQSSKDLAIQDEKLRQEEIKTQILKDKLIKTTNELTEAEKQQAAATKQETIVNSQSSGTLEKIIAQNKLLTAEKKKLNLETEAGKNRLKEINDQLNKNAEFQKRAGSSEEQRIRGIGQYKEALTGLVTKFAVVGTAIAAGKKVLDFFANASEEVADRISFAMAGFSGAIGVLKGDITSAFVDIDDSMNLSGENTKHWYSTVLATTKGIGQFIKMYVMEGALALPKIFETVSKSIEDTEKKMNDAANAMIAYTKGMDQLEEAEISAIVPRAEANLQLKKARELLLDENITIQEKIKRTKEVSELEDKTTKEEIDRNNIKVSLLRKAVEAEKIAGLEGNKETRRKLAEAEADSKKLEDESVTRKLKLNKALIKLDKEADKQLADKLKFEADLEKDATKKLDAEYKAKLELAKQYGTDVLLVDNWYYGEKAKIKADQDAKDAKNREDSLQMARDMVQEVYADEIASLNEQYTAKIEAAGANEELVKEINAQNALDEIQLEVDKTAMLLEIAGKGTKEYSDLLIKLSDLKKNLATTSSNYQISKSKETAEKEKQILVERTATLLKYSEDVGVALGGLIAGQKNATKELLKVIVKGTLQQLKALSYIWVGQAIGMSMASPESIATFGIAGAIKAAAITVAIEGAVKAAEIGANSLIDSFEKGTSNAPGGLAWVSEKGPELMEHNGMSMLTPNKQTLMYIPKGAKITPNDEIKQGLRGITSMSESNWNNYSIESIVDAINNKKQLAVNITEGGLYISTREGSRTIDYINKQYKGEC